MASNPVHVHAATKGTKKPKRVVSIYFEDWRRWWNCSRCIDFVRAEMGKLNWEKARRSSETRIISIRRPRNKAEKVSPWDPVDKANGKGGPVRSLSSEEIAVLYKRGPRP